MPRARRDIPSLRAKGQSGPRCLWRRSTPNSCAKNKKWAARPTVRSPRLTYRGYGTLVVDCALYIGNSGACARLADASGAPHQAEKPRPAAGGNRFFLVTGRRPIGRAVQPVTLDARYRDEGGMNVNRGGDPLGVIGIVGGEPQFGAGTQRARQLFKRLDGDDAPLLVALLRPGIGKQDEGA